MVKALNIIHKGLLAGILLFFGIGLYLNRTMGIKPVAVEVERILQVAAIVLAATGFFAGSRIFKNKLRLIQNSQTGLRDKLNIYMSGCIVQWALLEGPALFCIVGFMLTGNYAFFALTVVMAFLIITTAPAKPKVALQLGVTEADLDVI